jgi:hypothetical protein
MPWTYNPASLGKLITGGVVYPFMPPPFDDISLLAREIYHAMCERAVAVGVNPATITSVLTGDLDAVALLNNWRDRLRLDIIPKYWNVNLPTPVLWTLPTVRLAAGLENNIWYKNAYLATFANNVAVGDLITWHLFYELYMVINQLRWLAVNYSSCQGKTILASAYDDIYDPGFSWARLWTWAKNNYHGSVWHVSGGNFPGPGCAFYGYNYAIGLYRDAYIVNLRMDDVVYVIPNYSVSVVATKLSVPFTVWGVVSGAVDVFEQANFGGVPVPVVISGTGDRVAGLGGSVVVDVAVVTKNTTVHYSLRNNPYDADPAADLPNPDDAEPTPPPYGTSAHPVFQGYRAGAGVVFAQLGFDYI